MRKKSKLILAIALPVQIFALKGLSYFPSFIEKYYSQGVYPFLSKIFRFLFGWVPFSVGDIFYLFIGIALLYWFVKNMKRIKGDTVSFFVDIMAGVSIIYFMFNVLWGFNYYREPLHKTLQLDTQYTTPYLIETTKKLIIKSNTLHTKLGYAATEKIDFPYSQKQLFEKAAQSYGSLSHKYPHFAYTNNSTKTSLWSLGLTYMGYSGYYNPFSGEAQVNALIKTYKFPVVSCHEQAHQLGYAAENEANFLAYLATISSQDPYIEYAGYIFALRYCVNEIARRDIDTYRELLKDINPGILESYKEMREFWASYENPFEVISKLFWDQFLKANNQSNGIKSYSYMVALVLNYHKQYPIE